MDYRDNRQRWAESHQVVHFYAGQWCTFTPALTVRHDKVMFHRQRPDWIQTDAEAFDALFNIHEPLSTEDLNRLLARPVEPPDEYLGDRELTYPRRVLAVDVGDSTKEPESE